MSEVRRAEKVGSADYVEHADHVATVDHTDSVAFTPSPDQRKVRLLTYVAATLFTFALALSLFIAAFTLVTRHQADQSNRANIAGLTEQQKATADQLAATLAASDERVDCAARYTRAITAASQANSSALNRAVLAVAENGPGTPEREAAALVARTALIAADVAYADAIRNRETYVAAGSPLPCPIKETP